MLMVGFRGGGGGSPSMFVGLDGEAAVAEDFGVEVRAVDVSVDFWTCSERLSPSWTCSLP